LIELAKETNTPIAGKDFKPADIDENNSCSRTCESTRYTRLVLDNILGNRMASCWTIRIISGQRKFQS
jgi:hypothetical protein